MQQKRSLFKKKDYSLLALRRRLLATIAVLFILFALISLFLFYLSERKAFAENMQDANDVMAEQVASVYELYMQNVKDIAHDSTFRNDDLIFLSAKERQSHSAKRDILNMLSSLSVMNYYIDSAYLYYSEDGQVYSSRSLPYTVNPIEYFKDREVFPDNGERRHAYQIMPHLLDIEVFSSAPANQPLVLSYVVPVTHRSGSTYLCLNVNLRALYAVTMREFEYDENRNFYITDENGYIVFHRDADNLFIPADSLEKKDGVLRSEAHSEALNLNFVFESTIPPLQSRIYSFSLWLALALGFAILISLVVIVYSTLPFHRLMQVAKRSNLREFLAKPGEAPDLSLLDRSAYDARHYLIAVFRIEDPAEAEAFLNGVVKLSAQAEFEFNFVAVKTTSRTIAVIFGNKGGFTASQFRTWAKVFCEDLAADFAGKSAFGCVLSGIEEEITALREAYRDCLELFRYRYLFPSEVISSEEIDKNLPAYPFNVKNERHIINNLLAGNSERCLAVADKIFADFAGGEYLIKDSEIRRYLTVMQQNISLRLQALPIRLNIPSENNFEDCADLAEVREQFTAYLKKALKEIAKVPQKQEDSLNADVMRFIEDNYCDNDICLSMIADAFSLSSNQISRIVKEESKRNFSSYITYKRIQKSKELLAEGEMNINDISEAVGFSYPYYYIRKFKESEGVTPGQYISPDPQEKQ